MCSLIGGFSPALAMARAPAGVSLARRALPQFHDDPAGWGVASASSHFAVERGVHPIYAPDSGFMDAMRRHSRDDASLNESLWVGHARFATVGPVGLENNHPFSAKGWTLVHNGTVRAFDDIRSKIVALIDPELRPLIQGTTDSEHLFYLYLTFLKGQTSDLANANAVQAQRAVDQAVSTAARLSYEYAFARGDRKPSAINLIVMSKNAVVTSRYNETLYAGANLNGAATPTLLVPGQPAQSFHLGSGPINAWDQLLPNRATVFTDRDSPLMTQPLSAREDWLPLGAVPRAPKT